MLLVKENKIREGVKIKIKIKNKVGFVKYNFKKLQQKNSGAHGDDTGIWGL